jgi:hypothetical protein
MNVLSAHFWTRSGSRSQNAIRLTDTGESIVELILDTVPAPIE